MRIRRASGGREGELLHRASTLREKVDSLLPTLQGDAPREKFDSVRAELEEVREARDDAKQLERFGGGWRDPMVKAYAGLLKFYLDPGQLVVSVARFPAGEISFAAFNGAPKEAHIAVQQGADPRKLLLGYLAWARKGLHFFATADRLYCTGRSPEPPAEFRRAQIDGLPYRLSSADGGKTFGCSHLQAGEHRPFLEVEWTGVPARLRVCERCVRDDRQLLSGLTSGLAVPDAEGSFPVRASLNVSCRLGDACLHARLPELSRSLRKNYQFGKRSDAALLKEFVEENRQRLQGSREPLYVAAGVCYGSDRAKFLDALDPSGDERRALDQILPEVGGYFEVDEAAASRALEKLWPSHADAIVRAIVPDANRAQRLVKEAKANPGRVSDLLRRAARETREREVLESLPQYEALSNEAAFVDSVARTYRTHGSAEAAKRLLQLLPREGKERGIGFGVLLALGQAAPHRWQFTDTEQQFGETLAPAAEGAWRAPTD
jgi:hypothetical protein